MFNNSVWTLGTSNLNTMFWTNYMLRFEGIFFLFQRVFWFVVKPKKVIKKKKKVFLAHGEKYETFRIF